MNVDQILKMDDDELRDAFSDYASHEIKELSKQVNKARDMLYRKNRDYKNTNVREVFFQRELIRFMEAIHSYNAKRAFLLQFFYALRISEISACEWNRKSGMLVVDLSKTHRTQRIPVHGETDKLLEDYHEFADMSTGYLRKVFRRVREDVGLDMTYAESEDGRDLYQFRSHCLRKTAATMLHDQTDSDMKMKEFLGHSQSGNATASYHGYWREKYKNDLEATFSHYYGLIRE